MYIHAQKQKSVLPNISLPSRVADSRNFEIPLQPNLDIQTEIATRLDQPVFQNKLPRR